MKVKITQEDAREIEHKLNVLRDSEDLMADYGIEETQVTSVLVTLPRGGGEWIVPAWADDAVRGEMQDHAVVLRGIAGDARAGGEVGQGLRIDKQAKKFEMLFGQEVGK